MPLTPKSRAVIIALGIFVLGIVCGVGVDRWVLKSHRPWSRMMGDRPPPGGRRDRILNRYAKDLDLTQEQREKVQTILEQSRESMGSLRKQMREGFREALSETRTRIREILTAEQAEKFDQMSKRMDERMKERRGGRRGWRR